VILFLFQVVLLDEQGIDIESEEMAELIGGAADKV